MKQAFLLLDSTASITLHCGVGSRLAGLTAASCAATCMVPGINHDMAM